MNFTTLATAISLVFIGGILLVQLWFNTFDWETLAKIIVTYVVLWAAAGMVILLRRKAPEDQ